MELQKIKIDLLEQNTGQVAGLPANPRQWTRTELDKLVKSIQETPELLDARGLIVTRIAEDKYVVLGGNMRLDACLELGYTEMPCFVLPDDAPVEKLKEIVIKDNGSFGKWDWDAIANEWDATEIQDWGLNLPMMESDIDVDEFFDSVGKEEEKPTETKIVVHIPDELKDARTEILETVEKSLIGYDGVKCK